MLRIVFVVLLRLALISIEGTNGRPCHENPLCVCHNDLSKDVICDGVAFFRLPLALVDNHVTTSLVIMRSNISEIPDDVFFQAKLTALTIADSQLSRIAICAFCGSIESSLVNLDLSGNSFFDFPIRSLVKLHNLQWLSLRRNHIMMLDFDQDEENVGFPLYDNLVTLLLGDNHIGNIKSATFAKFSQLQTLELSNNGIMALEKGTFPPTLVTLYLDSNLLKVIPFEAIENLEKLHWLHLRDNHIAKLTMPPKLHFKRLISLDLGENLIRSIAEPILGAVEVQNIELDGNHLYKVEENFFDALTADTALSLKGNILSRLSSKVFARYKPKEINLSFNSFEVAPVEALEESRVERLNLSRNSLRSFTAKLCQLTELYLSQNWVEEVPSLPCSNNLKVLDISKNRIRSIPNNALPFTSLHTLDLSDNALLWLDGIAFKVPANVKHLNVAHNRLQTFPADLVSHLRSLESLNLMNNALEGYIDLGNFATLKRLDLRLNRQLKEAIEFKAVFRELDFSFTKIPNEYILPVARRLSKFNFQLYPHELLASLFAQNFPELVVIDMRFSAISKVNPNALHYLETLETVLWSHCRIEALSDMAFNRLPALQLLDLSHNRLRSLSLNSFCQLSDFEIVPSTLDLSHNQISSLKAQDDHLEYECQNYITLMNLSNNEISVIEFNAFLTVKNTLLDLDLSHNLLDDQQLKKFIDLKKISRLNLSHNKIGFLPRRAMTGLFNLQELDLSYNFIQQISPSALASLQKLRVLDLAGNSISFIPIDAFNGTSIEFLNLERNQLPSLKNTAFRSISQTLTKLSLSHNEDMHAITTGEFNFLTELLHLDISDCAIKSITPNSFNDLSLLISLDISDNWLSYLEAQTFDHLSLLQNLKMANCSLRTLPALHLPDLRTLSLASNRLGKLQETSFTTARKIQDLDLSNNKFEEIPSNLWGVLSEIRVLKFSANPINAIFERSFSQLQLIEEISLDSLSDIQNLDIRALSRNRRLKSLSTWTYTGIGAFRLEALLSNCPALRELNIEVEVPTLSDQIQWGFGHKLRRLCLRGRKWKAMTSDALIGLEGVQDTNKKEIEIIVSGTSVEEMHFGFIEKLTCQPRRVNLDLRGNAFRRFISENKDDVLNTSQSYPRASLGFLEVDVQEDCSCERNHWISAWRVRSPNFSPAMCRESPTWTEFVADVRCSVTEDYTAVDEESERIISSTSSKLPSVRYLFCTLLSLLPVIFQ